MPIIETLEDVTPATLSVMERTRDPRLREILVALAGHLHAFVREVQLTEREFQRAPAQLPALGQQSTERTNAVALLAGSPGLSPPTCMMTNAHGDTSPTLHG